MSLEPLTELTPLLKGCKSQKYIKKDLAKRDLRLKKIGLYTLGGITGLTGLSLIPTLGAVIAGKTVFVAALGIEGVTTTISGFVYSFFNSMCDLTDYSNPDVIKKKIHDLTHSNLMDFSLKYATKIESLEKYGFINDQTAKKMKYFIFERKRLLGYLAKCEQTHKEEIYLNDSLENSPGYLIPYFRSKENLKKLNSKWNTFRQTDIIPNLPKDALVLLL